MKSQHARANCKLCCTSANSGTFRIVYKLIRAKQRAARAQSGSFADIQIAICIIPFSQIFDICVSKFFQYPGYYKKIAVPGYSKEKCVRTYKIGPGYSKHVPGWSKFRARLYVSNSSYVFTFQTPGIETYFNQPSIYGPPTTNSQFSDSEPKPPPTFLLTPTSTPITPIPRMTNGIALRFFHCKSLEMRLTPFFTALTSLPSPNQQFKVLCSTYENSIFGHRQPTQTPKK